MSPRMLAVERMTRKARLAGSSGHRALRSLAHSVGEEREEILVPDADAPRAEQRVPGRTETIEYETADGKWHTETAAGSDRPETDIEDTQ